MEWPSAKMSASTVTRSPTIRLIGKRPPSTSGFTPSMIPRRSVSTDFSTSIVLEFKMLALHQHGAYAAKFLVVPEGQDPGNLIRLYTGGWSARTSWIAGCFDPGSFRSQLVQPMTIQYAGIGLRCDSIEGRGPR